MHRALVVLLAFSMDDALRSSKRDRSGRDQVGRVQPARDRTSRARPALEAEQRLKQLEREAEQTVCAMLLHLLGHLSPTLPSVLNLNIPVSQPRQPRDETGKARPAREAEQLLNRQRREAEQQARHEYNYTLV